MPHLVSLQVEQLMRQDDGGVHRLAPEDVVEFIDGCVFEFLGNMEDTAQNFFMGREVDQTNGNVYHITRIYAILEVPASQRVPMLVSFPQFLGMPR